MVESTVTETVPDGAVDPEAAVTVTVKLTSVPLGLYDGLSGVWPLIVVVVPIATPCNVPVSVRLPTVDAGR
jgi:hypothetical protein